MADVPFTEVMSGTFLTGSASMIHVTTPYQQYGYSENALTFSVARSGSQLRVDFVRPLTSLAATSLSGNYTVTGPSTITTTSVNFTASNSYVLLNTNGSYLYGTYTLTLASRTAQAAGDLQYNVTSGVNFEGAVNVRFGGFNPGYN